MAGHNQTPRPACFYKQGGKQYFPARKSAVGSVGGLLDRRIPHSGAVHNIGADCDKARNNDQGRKDFGHCASVVFIADMRFMLHSSLPHFKHEDGSNIPHLK
jgi:hypothetical protein